MLDKFVTLGAVLLDPSAHQVTFVNAGHLPPLIYRKTTGQVEEGMSRDQGGFPLGTMPDTQYEASGVALNPGDTVLLISDGVTEARNKQEKEFQLEGVHAAFKAGPNNAKALGERLVGAVKKHFTGCKQHDDITVVCFGRV